MSKVYWVRDKNTVIKLGLAQPITSQSVICPHCKCVITSGRLDRHILRTHGPAAVKRREEKAAKRAAKAEKDKEIVACDLCDEKMQARHLKNHKLKDHKIGVSLVLISRRALRVVGIRICDGCMKESPETWRYTESSRGTVHLCQICKQRNYEKSFVKKTNALDYCTFGGGFESNRRKF